MVEYTVGDTQWSTDVLVLEPSQSYTDLMKCKDCHRLYYHFLLVESTVLQLDDMLLVKSS